MRSKLGVATLLIAVLGLFAGHAQAGPVLYSSSQFDTTAFAISGALADTQFDSSPSPLPLVSSAVVVGANDFASGAAVGASGLLLTSAEADSFGRGVGASAGGQSHFAGIFSGTGPLSLHLDFTDTSSFVGGGTTSGTLFVILTTTLGTTTTTLFNDFFTSGGVFDLSFASLGDSTTLDLVLFSEAASTSAGQSVQNFAQVTFDASTGAAVPIPSTLPLALLGLAVMFLVRRKVVAG
jgi:hypothetical protein